MKAMNKMGWDAARKNGRHCFTRGYVAVMALILMGWLAGQPAVAVEGASNVAASTPVPSAKAAPAAKKKPARKSVAAPVVDVPHQLILAVGKSTQMKLPSPATRISIGNPAVADVILLNPREVYLLGKSVGTTNVILWNTRGTSRVVDVAVGGDAEALQEQLRLILPTEKNIHVKAVADSLILMGTVADSIKVDRAMSMAQAFTGGSKQKVVNMLQTGDPQQVMLEVKVAEVSKTLLDKLGLEFKGQRTGGGWTYSLVSSFLFPSAGGTASIVRDANNAISLTAQKDDGLVKILAEPNIMAMSGQEGSFLAGGKIYIPVPQSGSTGTTITLEEKEFGVGLRFLPTVLEGGRINLRVTPEVSELSSTGTTITNGSYTSVLPTITTRRASTTVQLYDGQSFAIGGLIKNNVTETMKALPILGEIPILGALFRSSEFQRDKTELLFVVTPRLVKPLPPNYSLPTDSYIEPSRSDYFLGGQMEGKPKEAVPADGKKEGAAQDAAKGGVPPKTDAGAKKAPDANGFMMK